MSFFEMVVAIILLSTGGKIFQQLLAFRQENKREQRRFKHEVQIAQIQAGHVPEAAPTSQQLKAMQQLVEKLRADNADLQDRVEQLETIVTHSALDLDSKFRQLLHDGDPKSRHLRS